MTVPPVIDKFMSSLDFVSSFIVQRSGTIDVKIMNNYADVGKSPGPWIRLRLR